MVFSNRVVLIKGNLGSDDFSGGWVCEMENLQDYEELSLEEDDLVKQLILDWIFFSPSPELVRLILAQNDKLGSEYFKNQCHIGTEPVEGLSKDLLQGPWKAFDILFHKSKQKESGSQSEKEIISSFQAFFSERIFNHLAMLSRTPYARSGTFSIREELTIELAEKIGLGLYLHEKTSPDLRDETENILLRLAGEFQYWFIEEHKGVFHTVWGSMLSVAREELKEEISDNTIILVPDVEGP
jgi:hypothetical protein